MQKLRKYLIDSVADKVISENMEAFFELAQIYEGDDIMPTICMFRGIKIYINWREHQPPISTQLTEEKKLLYQSEI